MKQIFICLSMLCIYITSAAQDMLDSTDIFYRHLKLNETVVTGVSGATKLKHSTFPVNIMSGRELQATASTNIIDAISRQPGVAQITTGSGISKPVIRGLGYNRVITISDGVRQEGQQWGDEHGIEVDGQSVHSIEIIKGPASLIYGSDAMAGVVILNPAPPLPEGQTRATLASEYQTNSGLFGYTLNAAGNHRGLVWDARLSDKMAHAYKNRLDGYVPGSQMRERAARAMVGLNRAWGHSHLVLSYFHQTPSIIEGERDEDSGALLSSDGWHRKGYGRSLPFQQVRHYKAVLDNSLNLGPGRLKAIVGYQQNRRQEYEESADDYELYFRLHTLTYDLRYLAAETRGWRLTGGVNGMWQQSQNLGEEQLIPEYTLFDIGTYATAERTLHRWTLNGGLRHNYRHIGFGHRNLNATTGSLGAVWNACRHTNVRLNLARGYRAPNMSELGSDGVHEGSLRYELGNPNLKAEYSWQADLGIDHSGRLISVQAALFANRIQNYIFAKRTDMVVDEDYSTYIYTQGDARLLGLEVGADFHPLHAVHLANTFSYVSAQQMHQGRDTKYLPLTPAPRWTSELKVELNHDGHLFCNSYVALTMECNMRQNRYYRADDTETRTPGYALFGLSAGTTLKTKKRKIADIFVSADNLFDKAYQNHLSRLKYADANLATGRRGVYNMGRNIAVKAIFQLY